MKGQNKVEQTILAKSYMEMVRAGIGEEFGVGRILF